MIFFYDVSIFFMLLFTMFYIWLVTQKAKTMSFKYILIALIFYLDFFTVLDSFRLFFQSIHDQFYVFLRNTIISLFRFIVPYLNVITFWKPNSNWDQWINCIVFLDKTFEFTYYKIYRFLSSFSKLNGTGSSKRLDPCVLQLMSNKLYTIMIRTLTNLL